MQTENTTSGNMKTISNMDDDNSVVVMLVGDPGSGKSSFGNLYLKKEAFETSQRPLPCTLIPNYESNVVDGMERTVIDTEGFDDGVHSVEEQIQRLAVMLRRYNIGISAIGVVIQAEQLRITQGVKNVIKFVYDAFGDVILSHLCIIFTHCTRRFPDRTIKNNSYKNAIIKYLTEISGKDTIQGLPIYYFNCMKPEKDFVAENLMHFHGWVASRQKFCSSEVRDADFGYTTQEEKEEGHSIGIVTEGNITYENFIDRMRVKYIPNNNSEKPSYSEWETTKEYRKKIKEVSEERVDNSFLCYSFEGDKKYEITIDKVRTITVDFETGQVEHGPWGEIARHKKVVDSTKEREETTTSSWVEVVKGGYNIVCAKFRRKIIITPDGNVNFGDEIEIPGTRVSQFIKNEVVVVKKGGCLLI
ncbi:hypothetical protein TVAG_226530 [Trichomonas vaginalis G3]|uniref:AIG1-type G domain-containing protein n=1 Tax=Trichomonas vaginalis (strain ATCC PRA-98 / G3) TaxID=412133 RepID=A2ER87_TRIV3|nr:GTPase, IMAP family member-related family [Trichomonas vaginalis G3]EAY04840.1 hypothetical protein TVAG_226530 [Trichomonas vaginalis G3]KAI5535362.1 GTPase, IMAP family member-related family [Trichomonas vaginalis G3]|eukprot:XP_001317063.1 hypothetical protein [Trichomonas vaginalis G3]